MNFDKKYVMRIVDEYYIWFGECDNKTYFGIDKISQVSECDLIHISLNNMGQYEDEIYIHFGNSIYKADTKTLKILNIAENIYEVYFLDKCIVAVQSKQNRLDEMIKIIPWENKIISMGILQKENILR